MKEDYINAQTISAIVMHMKNKNEEQTLICCKLSLIISSRQKLFPTMLSHVDRSHIYLFLG